MGSPHTVCRCRSRSADLAAGHSPILNFQLRWALARRTACSCSGCSALHKGQASLSARISAFSATRRRGGWVCLTRATPPISRKAGGPCWPAACLPTRASSSPFALLRFFSQTRAFPVRPTDTARLEREARYGPTHVAAIDFGPLRSHHVSGPPGRTISVACVKPRRS